MEKQKTSEEVFELARRVEQMESALFFWNESLERLYSKSIKLDNSNSIEDLHSLTYEVSRLLPNTISFVSNATIETQELCSNLYAISREVEELELKKTLA